MWQIALGSGVVAAIVSGSVSFMLHWLSGLREVAARRHENLAEAFSTYASYREFPYVIRRRRADRPEEERARISAELQRVQERLSFYLAWTRLEDDEVGKRYQALVDEARRVAGNEMRKAWTLPPVSTDVEMNIADIDLASLTPLEDAFVSAMRAVK
jgi:hypothetical protein